LKRLTNLEEDTEVQEIANEWLTAPVDLAKVRERLNKCVAIFSDNDSYVPLDNQEDFREKLGAEIIIEPQRGHFSGSQGVTELPSALEAVLKIAGDK
jgi:predicted alpha/beta hydrolase family esterase